MKIAVGLLLLAGLLAVLFFVVLPARQDGIRLRLDFAATWLRGLLDPVQPLPTANPTVVQQVAALPTWTVTVSPTLPGFTSTPGAPTLTASPVVTVPPTLTPTPLPSKVTLNPPAFEQQDINNCGPATLAMYLRYYGWEGDQFVISDQIKPKRDDRNVNIEEMLSYLLNHVASLEAQYRVGGDVDLLRRLLAGGFPVVVEEGFVGLDSYWPNDDRWAGHYLLLTGYDDAARVFFVHDSFLGKDRTVPYYVLDGNWKAFNRVYLLVYPHQARETIQAILGAQWSVDQNRQFALEAAQHEIELDSTDSYAWFNLGTNLVYFERYAEAARAYDTARSLGLPQRMLRYQFGPFFAYFHVGRNEDLLALTDYALERTPNAEEAMLWKGWALYRLGDRDEAEKMFKKALSVRPGYSDAQYALDFLQSN